MWGMLNGMVLRVRKEISEGSKRSGKNKKTWKTDSVEFKKQSKNLYISSLNTNFTN